MKGTSLVAVLAIVIAALALNPKLADHKQEVDQALVEQVGGADPVARLAAKGLGFILNFSDLKYQNYFVFSVVTLDNEPISYGAFGQVHVKPLAPQNDRRVR